MDIISKESEYYDRNNGSSESEGRGVEDEHSVSLVDRFSGAEGSKVLCIDLDPQCNLTVSSGASMKGITVFEVLTEKATVEAEIQKTELGEMIAGHKGLSGLEVLLTQVGREYRLRNRLKPLIGKEPSSGKYDVIILDTPPSLGILTINALTACTKVIIPANADFFSMYGISQLGETIESVREYTNPEIKIEGILLTRYMARTILSRDMTENIKGLAERLKTKVFRTTIREAQVLQKSIFKFAPKAKVTQDYVDFIEELCEEEGAL